MASKYCCRCSQTKSKKDFHKDASRKDGHYPYCKPCRKEFCQNSYYDNPIRQRHRAVKYKYGISFKELRLKAQNQNYKCTICTKDFKKEFEDYNHKFIHVDHCHSSGKVRDLLCQDCNHLLGNAKDNTSILQNAINYLQRHTRRVVL